MIEPLTLEQFKNYHEANGGKWFSPGAMKFFAARVETDLINGCYFITSEQFKCPGHATGKRYFTIRKADMHSLSVETIGTFQQYTTKAAAIKAAEAL